MIKKKKFLLKLEKEKKNIPQIYQTLYIHSKKKKMRYIKQYIYTFIDQKKKSLLKLEKEKKNIPQIYQTIIDQKKKKLTLEEEKKNIPQIHKTPYTIIDQQQNRSMVPWL